MSSLFFILRSCLTSFYISIFAVVKAALAVKHSKKSGEGTSRIPQEPEQAEAPAQPTNVLNLTLVSGPLRLASPTEQTQGFSSHLSGPTDVPASFPPPADPVIISSGDGNPCHGIGSSQSGAGSRAVMKFGPVPTSF